MNKTSYIFFSIIFLLVSCAEGNVSKNDISFYHWKANAEFTESYENALDAANTRKIYMHYFDIEAVNKPNWYDDGIYPTYVLKDVAEEYQDFDIVPVVYITNEALKTKDLKIEKLAAKIEKLIDQISLAHFNKKITEIQIDCDWTQSTRYVYFKLLEILNKSYKIDVTIRLHQVKFKEKTGIPPVETGTLMVYNIGALKNRQQNSILENSIVKQYITTDTKYPLPLKIALPLFSQTVVSNNDDNIKLIRNTNRTFLENDTHFKKIDDNNFQIVKDTLYKGFYLSKGFNLKLEELKQAEIIASYHTIKESDLEIDETVFYHLNDASLTAFNLTEIFKNL